MQLFIDVCEPQG